MLHSEKNGLKISKLQLQHFMQNSILEQAKMSEQGADYMKWAAQVKILPI